MTEEQKPKQELKHLVRIANADLKGQKQIGYALKNVKGIGLMCANAVCKIANIELHKKVGFLTDEEIKKLNDIIKNLDKQKLPEWLLNRRKDPETGENKHIVTSDLQFIKANDIKSMKKIKSYIGVRHMRGLPVRGQKTRSNFRPNKGKVTGVKKPGKKGKKAGK